MMYFKRNYESNQIINIEKTVNKKKKHKKKINETKQKKKLKRCCQKTHIEHYVELFLYVLNVFYSIIWGILFESHYLRYLASYSFFSCSLEFTLVNIFITFYFIIFLSMFLIHTLP